MERTSQQLNEIEWWREHYKQNPEFLKLRMDDFKLRSSHLPYVKDEKGLGLDYGCGLLSMFEGSGLKVHAYDPLLIEYMNMFPPSQSFGLGVKYIYEITEQYDWIWCCNVLDHEEYPEKIVQDIYDHLKKGGNLYLEINFDELPSPCHYIQYNQQIVDSLMKKFNKLVQFDVPRPMYKQVMHYGVYKK